MTNAERQQCQKDYEEGRKMFPLDYALKDEARKRRRADKRRMTIAKKAAYACARQHDKFQKIMRDLTESLGFKPALEKDYARKFEAVPAMAELEIDEMLRALHEEKGDESVSEIDAF